MKFFISAFFTVLSFSSWAGEMIGNGGNGVVCKTAKSSTIELLDFAEAKTLLPHWTLDLGADHLSVEEKIEIALSRLERFSPQRARHYRALASKFLSDQLFTDNELDVVDDSKHLRVIIPKNCHVQQLALQLTDPLSPQGRKVLIYHPLWERMTNDQRAGLILHEVFYAEALHWRQKTSVNARIWTAWVSSVQPESFLLRDFISFQFKTNYDVYEIQGRRYTHNHPIHIENVMPLVDKQGHLIQGRRFSGCWIENFSGLACKN